MPCVIELRVYTLKPGTRDAFQRRFADEIAPMLERFGITVVTAQPSLHDERSFTLVRFFPSLADREAQLARFYGSEEWLTRHGYPNAILQEITADAEAAESVEGRAAA